MSTVLASKIGIPMQDCKRHYAAFSCFDQARLPSLFRRLAWQSQDRRSSTLSYIQASILLTLPPEAYMKLKSYIEKIKSNPKFNNKNFSGDFPNPSTLKEKPHLHLRIIVEQAEYLIAGNNNPKEFSAFIGIDTTKKDIDWLISNLIHDIEQFSTQHPELKLLDNVMMFSQSQLPSYTLFTLARSKILPDTYKNHIELLDQPRKFDLFSIPFLVRLSIENKLKAIIGFKSSKSKLSDGQNKVSDQFPALKVINFLQTSEHIISSLPFSEIKKIYNWSCGFVHTGNKEYIWLSLKAVSSLNNLFNYDYNRYYGQKINYLKPGVK